MYESACAGACPIVPNRLSYTEMYDPMFKQADTVDAAVKAILKYEQQDLSQPIAQLVNKLHNNFFSATHLINNLKEYNER
jgi:hypothetical protein